MAQIARIPIIKLYGNLIVSIQVTLSDRLVIQLKDDITAAIVKHDVHGLIIDVSGIDVMDSYISRALRDVSLIAKLMGVETVISGMHPVIAVTLVEMGLDLEGMHAAMDLEAALEHLETETRRKLQLDVEKDDLLEEHGLD